MIWLIVPANCLFKNMAEPLSKRKIVAQVRHKLVLKLDEYKMQERQRLERALVFAEDAHDGQYRRPSYASAKRGLPYIVHPMRVAMIILEELELKDPVAVNGAILHDVIESKREKIGIADIEREFGRAVAMIVSVLTAPEVGASESEEQARSRKNTYHQRIRQSSVVSKLVKLADRLDSVREAVIWLDQDLKTSYLEETREVYLPIAEATDSYLYEELHDACAHLEEAIKNPPEPAGAELDEDYFFKK